MFKAGKDLRLPDCALDWAQCNSPIRPILAADSEIGQNSQPHVEVQWAAVLITIPSWLWDPTFGQWNDEH